MSEVTREAIVRAITSAASRPTTVENPSDAYDALTRFLGHDLAELCRLGKAVLEQKWNRPFSADSTFQRGLITGYDDCVATIFARAGVERPEP